MKPFRPFALAVALAVPVSLSAATISGTVIDRTTNKPAAGDTVILVNLNQGMQDAGQTTVDAHGHYSFNVPDTTGMHLIRVVHDKAPYYGPVPPNTTTVDVDVYDVAPKVEGVHIYADVSRVETDPQGLVVTESYFLRNESKPPRTQFGPHAFEFYLPAGAVLEGSTAQGPGGMAVSDAPVPLGDKNHYAFLFPVRPGETRFQIGYRLPYSGSLALQARLTMPADNVAIMLPKSMSFSGAGFQPLPADANEPGINTWLATNVQPQKPVDYTVSGTGSMPREQQGGDQGQAAQAMGQAAAQPDQSGGAQPGAQPTPGGGLGTPIDTPDPLNKYKGWIISGIGLALVVVAAFVLRSKPGQRPALAGAAPATLPVGPASPVAAAPFRYASAATVATAQNGTGLKSALLAALKEELFSLETERLEGKLSESEYAELRSAFEVVLRRALARETTPTR